MGPERVWNVKALERWLRMNETMKPGHPRWQEFEDRLRNDFVECRSDLALSREILQTMDCVNVVSSLMFFREHGGYCDCEVILNVLGEEVAEEEKLKVEVTLQQLQMLRALVVRQWELYNLNKQILGPVDQDDYPAPSPALLRELYRVLCE